MKMTKEKSLLSFIKELGHPIFTTFELATISGKSLSTVTQALNYLESQGVIFKIYRGVWGEMGSDRISPYTIVPFLLPSNRAYVSFISALHLYGIIEQIPQVITVAATSHTKIIKTSISTYAIHRIAPWFFDGFTWYKGTENYLIAEPEKALVDSLYLSARKKKQFGHFPELHFPKSFSFKKAQEWVKRIPNVKIKTCVQKKLDRIMVGIH
jgi:predicted transcriptional regulator of viral defense system